MLVHDFISGILPDFTDWCVIRSFFDAIERILDPKYVPVDQDILRARLRTTGIVENTFCIEGVDFRQVLIFNFL